MNMLFWNKKKTIDTAALKSIESDIQKLIEDYYSADNIQLEHIVKNDGELILNMTIENKREIELGIRVR